VVYVALFIVLVRRTSRWQTDRFAARPMNGVGLRKELS
jgi:hypothetical protein